MTEWLAIKRTFLLKVCARCAIHVSRGGTGLPAHSPQTGQLVRGKACDVHFWGQGEGRATWSRLTVLILNNELKVKLPSSYSNETVSWTHSD